MKVEENTVYVVELGDNTWIESDQDSVVTVLVDNVDDSDELEEVELMKVEIDEEDEEDSEGGWTMKEAGWGNILVKTIRRMKDGD